MLLKETAQRRQQVESLVAAKEALESAFNRSAMQQNLLETQLSTASDDNVILEIENVVAFVLMQAHMSEMGLRFGALVAERNEMERAATQRGSQVEVLNGEVDRLNASLEGERVRFGRLREERDQLKRDFDGVVADASVSKEKLIERENNERELREEVMKLMLEREKLVEEGCEKERAIGEVKKERDLALRASAESARAIDELRGEVEVVLREKGEILKLNNAQEVKIIEMESELKQLNECLCGLREEEAVMRAKILELEGTLGLAAEKEETMAMEIRALAKQKEELEGSVEMLKEGRDGVQKVLNTVRKELVDKRREIDEIVREKNEIELMKVGLETEIVELQREVDGLRDVVHRLKESCRDFEEKNKHLISEVNHYRNSIEEVMLERDNIRKGFDEEKDKVKSLSLQVAGMEDKIEQMAAELGQMRSKREKLVGKNEMMGSRVGILMNEKDALQRSLVEARRESDDSRAKVEFSCNNSSQALALLKSTASLVCQYNDSEEEVLSDEQKPEEEIQPYVEQLDAIKKAFRSKNKMVADMKQQVVLLQNSVASANKMKSLWTVISSATTILAAALAAYVAKGH